MRGGWINKLLWTGILNIQGIVTCSRAPWQCSRNVLVPSPDAFSFFDLWVWFKPETPWLPAQCPAHWADQWMCCYLLRFFPGHPCFISLHYLSVLLFSYCFHKDFGTSWQNGWKTLQQPSLQSRLVLASTWKSYISKDAVNESQHSIFFAFLYKRQ